MKSALCIIAAKPDDKKDICRIFAKAGQLDELMIFEEGGKYRTNFFADLRTPRDGVTFLSTMSEALRRGEGKGGGDSSQFYEQLEKRLGYYAIMALKLAGEPVTSSNIHSFAAHAANSAEELATEKFRLKFHSRVLERAVARAKSPAELAELRLLLDFFLVEWPAMDPKTRTNGLAGFQGPLFNLNIGLCLEYAASPQPNFSAADVLAGRSLLVNFPPSVYGETGVILSAGIKQLMEQAILARDAGPESPFVTIWVDEAHSLVTAYDSTYIAMCRSHRGCLVFLTQSVSSFYATMKGENGRHQADALCANLSTWIVHACDPISAKAATAKLGRKKHMLWGGSSSPASNGGVWDALWGQSQSTASFSEHFEQVLEDNALMCGRTGGPQNGFLCDGTVIRNGLPFASTGEQFLQLAFSQKG